MFAKLAMEQVNYRFNVTRNGENHCMTNNNRTDLNQKNRIHQEAMAPDNHPFNVIKLANKNGMLISICDFGATWLSCTVPVGSEQREVLLGSHSIEAHVNQAAYLGATVGRYANRIKNATFTIDDRVYELTKNQNNHQLHGGSNGLSKKRWKIESVTNHSVTLSIHSKQGDQGFPGNLTVKVTYTLTEENQVQIDYEANIDQKSPINLTNHAYFNLDGEPNQAFGEQQIEIQADYYLPVDKEGIPYGYLTAVESDKMDLRQMKKIKDALTDHPVRSLFNGYDHAYLLNKSKSYDAKAISSDKKLVLIVQTTKPSIQFYSGNFLKGTINRQNKTYPNHAGFALESQFLPDSPNHLDWPQPSCIFESNQVYQHQTIYQFITK